MTDRTCCDRQNLNRMLRAPEVNDICLSCGMHWWKRHGKVRRYTRAQWDALMNGAIR